MKNKSEENIKKAMQHPDKLGAGAEKRRDLKSKKEIMTAVMREFERGTLFSGSGEKVKNKRQALAIALSEAKRMED